MTGSKAPSEERPSVVQSLRSALVRLTPKTIRAAAHVWRDLGAGAARWYMQRHLTRRVSKAAIRRDVQPDVERVVFICYGNILRSAAAEAMLKARSPTLGIPDLHVSSAGLRAYPGRPADPRGIAAAQELGVSLHAHRAQPLTEEIVRGADLLVIMDFINEAALFSRFPEARDKTRFLGALGGLPDDSVEIADPYRSDAATVRYCYQTIDRCIEQLSLTLRKTRSS